MTHRVKMNKCKCGKMLDYRVSPFMTTSKGVCRRCGAIHYIDEENIDWSIANGTGGGLTTYKLKISHAPRIRKN